MSLVLVILSQKNDSGAMDTITGQYFQFCIIIMPFINSAKYSDVDISAFTPLPKLITNAAEPSYNGA